MDVHVYLSYYIELHVRVSHPHSRVFCWVVCLCVFLTSVCVCRNVFMFLAYSFQSTSYLDLSSPGVGVCAHVYYTHLLK